MSHVIESWSPGQLFCESYLLFASRRVHPWHLQGGCSSYHHHSLFRRCSCGTQSTAFPANKGSSAFSFLVKSTPKAIVPKPDSTLVAWALFDPFRKRSMPCLLLCSCSGNNTTLLYMQWHQTNCSTTSMAGTLQVVQVTSFLLRPFSEKLLVRINSRLVGTMWTAMQVSKYLIYATMS